MKRHRSRKVVVWGLLAVVLGTIGFNIALDTVRPNWRDPEIGWRLHALRTLDRPQNRPLLIAFGSSRTQMGLAPAEIPTGVTVFNFGQAGAGPLHLSLNLHRVLAAGMTPDAVLFELMPTTFQQAGHAENFFAFTANRLSWADVTTLTPYCHDPAVLRANWFEHRLAPVHSTRHVLISHGLPGALPWNQRLDFQWKTMDRYGWVPYPFEVIPDSHRQQQTAAVKAQYEPHLRVFRPSDLPERALADAVLLCQSRGIAVGFYRMPEGPTFREWYAPGYRHAASEYLARLADKFHVPMFDTTDWLPDDDFADSHHLMKHGAKRFSRRFGEELTRWSAGRRTRTVAISYIKP